MGAASRLQHPAGAGHAVRGYIRRRAGPIPPGGRRLAPGPALTSRRSRWLQATVLTVLVLLLGGRFLADRTADRLWAGALGVAEPHEAIGELRFVLWAIAFLAATLWCVGQVYVFYRSIGSVHVPRRVGNLEIVEAVPRPYLLVGAVLLGLAIAIAASHDAGGWWSEYSLRRGRADLGIADPILNHDAGYYLFSLPWFRTLQQFTALLTGATLAVVGLLYTGVGAIRWQRRRLVVNDLARFHLAALLATFGLALFWGYRLEPAEYVGGFRGVALDAVLTEVRIPLARMLSLLALLVTVVSVAWLWLPNVFMVAGAWVLIAVASLTGTYLLPLLSGAVRPAQRLTIADLEASVASLERLAYNLDPQYVALTVPPPAEPRALLRQAPLFSSLPVWDGFAVTSALNSVARASGTQHRFWDAALHLYPGTNGRPAPVYLSVREVDINAVREAGLDSWERLHLAPYERSSGVVAIAASAAGRDGAPLFVPHLSRADSAIARGAELPLAQRDILFSPAASTFSIIRTDTAGVTGVPVGGLFRRLALAWALQSSSIATSDLVSDSSVILWERAVAPRLNRYAPFAEFETPYPVVAGGQLFWLATGYVTAPGFPLVRTIRFHDRNVRYLRAGVVGVVEARSGNTAVYLAADAGPLAATWARMLPGIVRPPDELPPSLAAHLRYPAELFMVQRELLGGTPPAGPPAVRPRPAVPVATSGGRRAESLAWWAGPWAGDTVSRVRAMIPLEEDDAGTLTAVMHGAVVDRRLRLEVTRLSPPVELVSAAEISQRLAGSRAPPVGVSGPRRTVALPGAVFTMQTAYVTGEAGHRLADVMVQWGDLVAHGHSLVDALEDASRTRAAPTGSDPAWIEARRWFDRLDQARARGDWVAFGRAYEELRRILGARLRTP